MSEVEQILDIARKSMERYPDWRWGQAVFNATADVRPDLADQVRGTLGDPFYMDKNVNGFLVWLDLKLSEENNA